MSCTILLIDDDPAFQKRLSTSLVAQGHEVMAVARPDEAIARATECRPDVVLIGRQQSPKRCLGVIRTLKQSRVIGESFCVLTCSERGTELKTNAMAMGVDECIDASLPSPLLEGCIDRLLKRVMALREAEAKLGVQEALLSSCLQKVEQLEQAQAELQRGMKEAEQKLQTKRQFLANMSHELRTPLGAIIGFAELLEMGAVGALSEQQQEFASHILNGSRHLLALVNDILDLSRIEAGKLKMSKGWTPLEQLIKSTIASIRGAFLNKGVSLTSESLITPVEILVDPVRIKQILYNLLSNAVKFTPEGGHVSLQVHVERDLVILCVQDTGIGIVPADMPRLFREFEQLSCGGMAEPKGAGLGLALTRRLVELHGGSIQVESQPGKGTTFTVALTTDIRPVSQ